VTAGEHHTVGLKSDGTVVAAGYHSYGQCDVDSWTGISQVSASTEHTVGLKSDDTVVAAGYEVDLAKWNLGTSTTEEGYSGCFIATAAYGTSTAAEIDTLRAFRDTVLLESTLGSQLVEWYYDVSPPVADFISENSLLRTIVRELVVEPIASLVEATESLWGN